MFHSEGRLAVVEPEKAKRIIVVGDLHGDLYSFESARKLFEKDDLLIFLGDYGDRGANSVEVIDGVRQLLSQYPERVITLKGNHEDYLFNGEPKFNPCTLQKEVYNKKGSWELYFDDLKKNFLDKLYLSAIIPNEILFVHGGVSSDINKGKLVNPDNYVENMVMWSDPCNRRGEQLDNRGFDTGVNFGEDVSEKVTKELDVKYIIRSHEPHRARNEILVEHQGRIVTLGSTTVYHGCPFILLLTSDNLPKNGEEVLKYAVHLPNPNETVHPEFLWTGRESNP